MNWDLNQLLLGSITGLYLVLTYVSGFRENQPRLAAVNGIICGLLIGYKIFS